MVLGTMRMSKQQRKDEYKSMHYLVWKTRLGGFHFGAFNHPTMCTAIDEMGEGDVGTQSIYGNRGVDISLMIPRSAGNHKTFNQRCGLSIEFNDGSLVGEHTDPRLTQQVKLILAIEGREGLTSEM